MKTTALAVLVLCSVTAALAAAPTQWNPRGNGGGGALFAPSFSPHAPGELYIACDMGEVFHTTDLAHWAAVDFRQLGGGRASRVAFTSDPRVLYVLRNDGNGDAPAKSTDGGATWTVLAADPTGNGAYFLAADPARSDRLIVSDYSTIWFSNNGGLTFTAKYSDATGNGAYVAGAFFDGTRIFVGTNAGLLVSQNDGATFAIQSLGGIPAGSVLASFSGAKQGATTRFFAVTASSADVYPGVMVEDFFASTLGMVTLDWGAAAWVARTTGIAATDHLNFVSTARRNVAKAMAAGQDDSGNPVVYRTTDAGAHWSATLTTASNGNVFTGWSGAGGDRGWGYGGGSVGFAVSPRDPDVAAWTDYGFVHLTTDGGAHWRQGYATFADQNPPGANTPTGRAYHSAGLEDTSWWGLTWSDTTNVFAAATDVRGLRSTDGGATWSFRYTGHTQNTMYLALKHPVSGKLYGATSSVHDLYQSTYLQDARIDGGTGQVLVSSDKGATWSLVHDFGHPVVWVAADPTDAETLYASVVHGSAGGVYRTTNLSSGASSTWTKLAVPPRTQGHPYTLTVLNDGTLVAGYSGRRDGTGAFTASAGVFTLPKNGSTWTDRSDNGMKYWTKDLVVDPHDAAQNTWYAGVFSGWGGPPNDLGGLYRTTDRGLHWTRIFTSQGVESCTLGPNDGNEMYVATETDGVYYTANAGAATPTFTRVAGYAFAHPMRVFFAPADDREVWVTSFGNGAAVGYVVPRDADGDGATDAVDCAPRDGAVWAVPADVTTLRVAKSGASLSLTWTATSAPGAAAAPTYDVVRSPSARDLITGAVCVATGTSATSASEGTPAGAAWFYLVRAKNACGATAGVDASGVPRLVRACP